MKTNSLKGSNCKSNGKHIFALKLKEDKLVFLFFPFPKLSSVQHNYYGPNGFYQLFYKSVFHILIAAHSIKSKILLCYLDYFVMDKIYSAAHYHFSLKLD